VPDTNLPEASASQPAQSEQPVVLSYEALQNQLKVGDVLAFGGTDLPSDMVKLATRSCFVHVAIVFSTEPPTASQKLEENTPQADSILIMESHVDVSLPSVGTGKCTLGVQMQWLSQRLETYDGNLWWAPLKFPLTAEGISAMQTWLRRMEAQQIPYDFTQAIEVGVAAFTRTQREHLTDYSALFCSELVTVSLQLAGALDSEINASAQTPADVMKFSCLQPPIAISIEDQDVKIKKR
jgi:hypothetical protein